MLNLQNWNGDLYPVYPVNSAQKQLYYNLMINKSLLQYITSFILVILLCLPSILFAHGGEKHKTSLGKDGILTKKISLDGTELKFKISSHDISLSILDKKSGKHIENSIVKIKIFSPDKSVEIQKLIEKDAYYKNSFSFEKKGTYKVLALIKIGDKKEKAGFQFNVE